MKFLTLMKALITSAPSAPPANYASRIRSGAALLVDVREPGEWRGGVAQLAERLPLSDLSGDRARWQEFLANVSDREVLLYCASGGRSGLAARLLKAEGYRAVNTGGLSDWAAAGWPVTPPSAQRSTPP